VALMAVRHELCVMTELVSIGDRVAVARSTQELVEQALHF
jgi:hypothetical protein